METIYNTKLNDENLQVMDTVKESFINCCKAKWALYKDILSQFSIYSDDIMDNCNDYSIWSSLMSRAKNAGVILKGRETKTQPCDKVVNIFEKYTSDQLKHFCNIMFVTDVIQWLYDEKNSKTYKGQKLIENDIWVSIQYKNANSRLEYYSLRTEAEQRKIKTKINALGLILDVLENDFDDLYDFIINNVQYAPIDDLRKLLGIIKKNFIINNAGRPTNEKKIYKYDADGNKVAEYKNRAECVEKDEIKKSMLSLVLSGKRNSYNGYKYVEE
jgi:hypothetical protein